MDTPNLRKLLEVLTLGMPRAPVVAARAELDALVENYRMAIKTIEEEQAIAVQQQRRAEKAEAEHTAAMELLRTARASRDELAGQLATLRAACARQVANIERWLETDISADAEESRSIYEQLKAALGDHSVEPTTMVHPGPVTMIEPEAPPADTSMQRDIDAFVAMLPDLLRAGNYDRWALIRDGALSGLFDTYAEVIEAGYERFGLTGFMAQEIAPLGIEIPRPSNYLKFKHMSHDAQVETLAAMGLTHADLVHKAEAEPESEGGHAD